MKPQPDANGGYESLGHCSGGIYDFAAGSRKGRVRRPSEPSQMYPAYNPSRGVSGERKYSSKSSRRT
eukprot:scaffold79940_cov35-Tisochrysis_lutea.AAC.3